MPRSGSGTYTLPSGNPVVTGTTIESNWANTTLSDIATTLTDSLSRSGQGGMTAALRVADGTQGAPGVGFANETGSGFYRAGTGEVWAVVQGAQTLNLDANGVTVPSDKATSIEGTFVFNETGADKDARFEGDTDANLLFTDASTDRVGVGTNTPAAKLDVNGTAAISGNVTLSGGTANGVLYLDGSKVATSGSALVFDGSNLGLGVTPSAWPASYKTIIAGNSAEYACYWGSSNTDGGLNAYGQTGLGNNITQGTKYTGTGAASFYLQSGGRHSWWNAPSGTAGNTISFTQAMTLDESGNLKVNGVVDSFYTGTTAGSQLGSFRLYGTGAGVTGEAQIRAVLDTGSITAASLQFYTGTTERARITSGGDLLVGTTSGSFSQVVKNGTYAFGISQTGTGNNVLLVDGAYSAGTQNLVVFAKSGTTTGTITYNGSAVAYNTTSDYRLKDNPQPLTGSGAFIDALQPKTWNWKTDGSRGVGFIAHEAQAVSPGSVVGEKDAVDAEGKPVMQAMEYGSAEFIANIIAELQSLRARVAALEAQP